MTFTDDNLEITRAGLWAAHSQLALHLLKIKVREFAAGVIPHPHPAKHGEPKVVGFKDRFDELIAEASKPLPELPTKEAIRATLESRT